MSMATPQAAETSPGQEISPAHAIGMILPASNRVVERTTAALLRAHRHSLPAGLDACFTRVPYHGHPADGYALPAFLTAAEMLAQAGVASLCWNATRGAGLGFAPDERLCERLARHTGLPVVSTALAARALLAHQPPRRIAILTQGTAAEGEAIAMMFRRQGVALVAARHLGVLDNAAAAGLPPAHLVAQAEALVAEAGPGARPEAILVWSTNLDGHACAGVVAARLGVPVLDAASLGVWAALQAGHRVRPPAPYAAQPGCG